MSKPVKFAEVQWGEREVLIEYQYVNEQNTTAPLVVFLHEGLGSVSMWRDFPQLLCERLSCRGLVYSRPGYGQSTQRDILENWSPDFMHRQATEVLPALLEVLSIDVSREKVWLFGHSDGGSIALLYASKFPENLAGLVVVAPHILVEQISITSISDARVAYLETNLRERLKRYHVNPDSAFWGWNDVWLSLEFRDWNITQELNTIRCPLLAVQGVEDEYGTLEQIHGIAREVPQCHLVELANCGHSPHKDQRDALIAAIQDFFQQQSQEIHP